MYCPMLGWGRVLGIRLIPLGVIASAIACGSAKPAESADSAAENIDANAEETPAASDAVEKSADSAGGQGDDGAASDGTQGGEPAAADDVQAVLQLVIDDEALQPFLHLEQPGRFPLRIAFGADVRDVSGV